VVGRRTAVRVLGLGAGAAATLVLLAGCDVGRSFGGFGWPQGITPQANRMYDLWIGSVVAALAVGFFVWGLIFWCVVRYRKRGDGLPVQTRFNLPVEIIYTVVPFLVVSVLFYYTAVIQTNVTAVPDDPPDVAVEVVAFKWNWRFNYLDRPTRKGEPAPTTLATTRGTSDYIPVLVVPTGQRVRFEENSDDVIHSFWVPDLLFKLDVFPGETARNTFEVTIEKEGAYIGRCAELCGIYHSMMNFEVRAVSPERYQQFLAAKQEGLSTPDALTAIGEDPFAVTTEPFETKRENDPANEREQG
jgi:cytochrome c oxidase subunit II